MVPKHRKKWTVEEKAESKHNSQALSVIFKSLPRAIFNQVQGCEAAKEAWDILVVMFEGTSRVKRTRLDNLASDFENLHMTETESVADYSSRLSGIAQEAVVLGKRYKDKKLVKKFLRSLPDKFQPHRSAIDVLLNSDELKYNQVVGMMQAFEIQLKKKEKVNEKSFALKAIEEQKLAESQEVADEEKVGLLVKKYFRKMERGQRKGTPSLMKSDTDKEIRKSDKQEQEEDDVVLETKNINEKVQSDSDGEEPDLSVEDQIELLIKTVLQKTQDNTQLISERVTLQLHIAMITKELSEEKAKMLRHEKQLEEQLKNIRILNKGTKNLDTLLSTGRSSNLKWGLGYQGANTNTTTQFVRGMESEPKLIEKKFSTTTRPYDQRSGKQNPRIPRGRVQPEQSTRPPYVSSGFQRMAQRPAQLSRRKRCWYCGHLTHYKAQCYQFQNRVSSLMQRGEFYPVVRRNTQGYVRKDDLYCHMAVTAEKSEVDQPKWYFDSGCSKHMTGALDNLSLLEDVVGGRVTFGDGRKGTIRGKGTTSGVSQPHLKDVFLVEGLKANLISISQLCDEGLDVTFTKKGCKAVDQQGSVRLRGRRSGNNCYMWKSSMQCFNATTELDAELWHQKLGQLNVCTMEKLANQEVVRGLPKLKTDLHFLKSDEGILLGYS
ncbi:PREDICTED: uncharacterized protein LOC104733421 [Camelina sativa]|uniref:Uncharacterized protein LOC104733421 n=1 Tax=Camelina sativa TaxID=90675 RepID=A0ABM0V5X8_CAMSA|nr:PREDICTED: uncharacterized protein LOC104733421 [Camelina sativa]